MGSKGAWIAQVSHYGGIKGARERDEANARLIAAAPDLLEALHELCNEATGFVGMASNEANGVTNIQVLRRKIAAGKAAIAKARSGS